MCGLFGFSDVNHSLSHSQAIKLVNALARASMVRGTDATGIAYVSHGRISCFKRPLPADKLHLYIPSDVTKVIGHVRMTTQGPAMQNFNNHPFTGQLKNGEFALAHNGVLYNDVELKISNHLPDTEIRTDSYVAAQILQSDGNLSMQSIRNMAEQLEGTFAFDILDSDNRLFLVRGNSPLVVWHEKRTDLYVYASTVEILKTALLKVKALRTKGYQKVDIGEGDILCIGTDGTPERAGFTVNPFSWGYLRDYKPYGYTGWKRSKTASDIIKPSALSPFDALIETAANMGYDADAIELLLEAGYDEDEIEMMLSENETFAYAVADAQYESLYW